MFPSHIYSHMLGRKAFLICMFIVPSNHNNGLKNAQNVCITYLLSILAKSLKEIIFLWDLFFSQMLLIILCTTTQGLFFVKLFYLGGTIPSQTLPQIFLQVKVTAATAAAKSLQLCPTLCDPRDGSPPGSPVPGILHARTLKWVAISFSMHESEKWKWSRSVMSDSLRPHWLQPTRLLCPWDFPGKSTGVGCHCLLWKLTEMTLIGNYGFHCTCDIIKVGLPLPKVTCA